MAVATLVAMAVLAAACSQGGGGAALAPAPGAPPGRASATTTTVPPPTVPPPATAPTCPATPRRALPDPQRPRYRLAVDVDLAANTVTGTTEVRFVPDLDTDRLVFRLWANGPRPTQAGGAIETGPVTVGGLPVGSALDGATVLVVDRGGRYSAGRAVDIVVPWTLRLPRSSSDRLSRDGDAVRLGSFYPVLAWEPGLGWATEPPTGSFAEASVAMVADFEMTVTVPEGLSVLASGVEDGPGRWSAPVHRDVAISVGRFTTAQATAMAPQPVEVTVGVHEGVADTTANYMPKVVAALELFGELYGPYPWPTFTLAITPNLGGGIEYPSHVMQGPGTSGSTTSHEVAHMWFYGLVGNNQGRDPWLDEGLASWGEARYEGTVADFAAATMPPAAAGRMGEPMSYWSAAPSAYYRGAYVQGVQALNALGPAELVDCALRTYVAVFAHRIARPADLIAALHSSFPDAPEVLERFGARP